MRAFTLSLAAIALAGVNVAAAPTPVVAADAHLARRLNIRRDHVFKVVRRQQDCDESSSPSSSSEASGAIPTADFNSTIAAYNGTLPYNGTLSSNSTSNSTSWGGKHSGYWSSQGASSGSSSDEDDDDCDDGDDTDEDEQTCPDGYEAVYEDDDGDDETTSASSTYTATYSAPETASATSTSTASAGGEVIAAAYKAKYHKSSHSSTSTSPSTSSSSAEETASSTSSSAPAASSTGSSGGSSGAVSGIATFFTQNGNPGACGNYNSDSTFLIAIRPEWYKNGQNCGKTVSITAANGVTQSAIIADECPSCDTVNSIDMSTGLWDSFGYPTSAGVFDVTWTCDGCSAP